MRMLFVSFLALWAQNVLAQFDITHRVEGDSVAYYGYNETFCPYTITLHPRVDTVEFGARHTFVLPPQVKHWRIIAYSKPTQAGKISSSEHAFLGDYRLRPDTSVVYSLPYAPNVRRRIMQGYNGRFSHKNQFALDFKMPVGSPIHAARAGVVVKLKQDSNVGGRNKKFAPHGNFIIIYHEDGSLAYYYHLQQNGCRVRLGEQVRQGQLIGLSGNTGWSTHPHLHFVVKYTEILEYGTVPTWFWVQKKGKPTRARLRAWRRYRACNV